MSLLRRVRFALIHVFGAAAVLVGAGSIAFAQQAPAPAPAIDKVPLTAGRSTVLMTEFDITRVAVTDPAIADATVVQPREVLIDGKMPGTVSLIIWGAAERRQYDLVVEPGVSTLEQRLQALFPGEDIRVTATGDAVILSGRVSSNEVSLRAAEIATATASKAKGRQPPAASGRRRKSAGPVEGSFRGGESTCAHRGRRLAVHESDRHQQHDWTRHHGSIPRRRVSTTLRQRKRAAVSVLRCRVRAVSSRSATS
jgi:Flp pilus assembly secretin CpaC